VAAVHGDDGAADETGPFRGHENDDIGHFVCRRGAIRRQAREQTLPAIRVPEFGIKAESRGQIS
jgi:hypothetical protein